VDVENAREQKEEQEKTSEKAHDVLEGNIKDNFIIYIKIKDNFIIYIKIKDNFIIYIKIIFDYFIQMTTIPACPPVPTLDELLNSGNFIEVNVDELVPEETVILYDPAVPNENYKIMCILIISNRPENAPSDVISYRYLSGAYPHENNRHTTMRRSWIRQRRFFRKINPRKDFDDVTKKMEVRIRNYPKNQQLTSAETIFTNKGLSDKIGNFLGPPISGKGGRRKRAGTKRGTRKNKRKSTRRTGRKCKKMKTYLKKRRI
jgi:hypothetical protein